MGAGAIMPEWAAGLPVVASVSGGKDSAALCLWLRERGISYRAIHMDTGWESPITDDYLRGPLERAIGPIQWITPPLGFADLCRKKGILPSRVKRFCTQHLKIYPMMRWCEGHYEGDIVNAVGIRAEESEQRASLEEWERSSYGWIWRPLLHWTEQQVIDMHKIHGLEPNPLYLRGMLRVGCWPCIFARKSEIATVARMDPARIAEIERLERELVNRMMNLAEGPCRHLPSFFYSKDCRITHIPKDENTGEPGFIIGPKRNRWPIRDTVRWAVGRQVEMFEDLPEDRGCMRWGMCE